MKDKIIRPTFKGNLGKLQEIAANLATESSRCWKEADERRRTAMSLLGAVDLMAQHEIMVLSAKAVAFREVAQEINDMLDGKKVNSLCAVNSVDNEKRLIIK